MPLSVLFRLPDRVTLLETLLADICRMRLPLLREEEPERLWLSAGSLSVGECMLLTLRLDIELDKFKFDAMPKLLG